MAFYTDKKKEISHRQIVFETIKDLQKKAAIEYKSNLKRIVDHGSWSETIFMPDSRKEFIQLCEFLSDLLFPEFDADMEKKYKKIIEKVESNLKEINNKKIIDNAYLNNKLELMREMFRELMTFLKRKDYLKETFYVEDDEDLDEEEEDEE